MSERILLEAIAAAPDDDAPRAVWADWLLERGDPRGELVRLQLAFARGDTSVKRKIDALLRKHRDTWLAPLRSLHKSLDGGFVRGMLERVGGRPEVIARVDAGLAAAVPMLSELVVTPGARNDLAPLAKATALRKVRSLSIVASSRKRLTAWDRLPTLPALRVLDLEEMSLAAEDTAAMFSRAPSLESLRIQGCRLNKRALAPLESVRWELRSIDLPAAHVGPLLGRALARMSGLQCVRVPGNEIGRDALGELLPALRGAAEIDLRGNDLDDAKAAALIGSLVAPRVLLLGDNPVGDATVRALVGSPAARSIRKLNLSRSAVTDDAARALAGAAVLAGLESLTMVDVPLAPETERALRESPHLASARLYLATSAVHFGVE